jgi:hypothetical protein
MNLEGVALPEGWPETVTEIELQVGRFESDFDIVRIPDKLALYLKSFGEERGLPFCRRRSPAGLNLTKIPVGATIRRVREDL